MDGLGFETCHSIMIPLNRSDEDGCKKDQYEVGKRTWYGAKYSTPFNFRPTGQGLQAFLTIPRGRYQSATKMSNKSMGHAGTCGSFVRMPKRIPQSWQVSNVMQDDDVRTELCSPQILRIKSGCFTLTISLSARTLKSGRPAIIAKMASGPARTPITPGCAPQKMTSLSMVSQNDIKLVTNYK